MKRLIPLWLLIFSVVTAYPGQIEVCGECPVQSIKQAVDLAQDGDRILVRKGVYREHDIAISKPLHFIGEMGAVIDGENRGTVLSIQASDFSLKGLTIVNVGQSYTKDFAGIFDPRIGEFCH